MRAARASLMLAMMSVLLWQTQAVSAGARDAQPDGSTPLQFAAREGDPDSGTTSLKELLPEVSHTDRVRLDQYLEDVRAIERRLAIAGRTSSELPTMAVPYGVPHVLVGGASGRLQGDGHLSYASRTVHTGNLLLSILDTFKFGVEKWGDSTGRLDGV